MNTLLTAVLVLCSLTANAQFESRRRAAVQLQRDGSSISVNGGNGSSPVMWLKLDESSGNTAEDSSGSNVGTLIGSPTQNPGHLNNSLTFSPGSDNYVDVADSPAIRVTSTFTFSCWYKSSTLPSAIGTAMWLLGKDTDTGRSYDFGFIADMDGVNCHLGVQINGVVNYTAVPSSAATAGDGMWHHVAVTFDGATYRFYINGTLQNGTPGSAPVATTTNLRIGARQYPGFHETFNGGIDEVKIWNIKLSDSEIAADASL